MVNDEVIELLESSDIEMNRLGLAYLGEYYKIKGIIPYCTDSGEHYNIKGVIPCCTESFSSEYLSKWINYEEFIDDTYKNYFNIPETSKAIYYNIIDILEKGNKPIGNLYDLPTYISIDNPNNFDLKHAFKYAGISYKEIYKYAYPRLIYDIQANYSIIDKNNIDQFNYNTNVKC